MSNNSSLGSYWQLPLAVTVFQLSVQIGLGVFGVVGNVLVFVTIMRRTSNLSALSPYLLSLACADLGILLFNHPLVVLRIQLQDKWILGKVICFSLNPIKEMFFGASIWTITAIAAERFVNIARKTKTIRLGKRKSLKKRACFIITAIWIISFAVTSIPIYLFVDYDPSKRSSCSSTIPFTVNRNVVTANSVMFYALPLGLIAYSYQSINRKVAQRSNAFLNQTPGCSLESSCSNKRAIRIQTRKTQKILKPLVILFAATMLPLQLFSLTAVYWGRSYGILYKSYYYVLLTLVNVAVAINAAADPLIYCVVNEDFRLEMKAALCSCFLYQKPVRKRHTLHATHSAV